MPIDTLAFKIAVTPALIAAASLAGRRWGPGVSGWFVGLPLTSGPVAVFLALDQGVSFAAGAAIGSLGGTIAQAVFAVAYGLVAVRARWPLALVAGSIAFAVVVVAVQHAPASLLAFGAAAVVVLAAALRLLPRGSEAPAPAPPPRWDLPARMLVTTALVIVLTSVAPALGPRLSGVLAAFPVYAAILTVFAHRPGGRAPAVQVLRGLLLGLFAFTGFFLVIGALIERLGIAAAFAAAIVTALAIQAASLRLVRAATPARVTR
jgi:hypothetical protein